MSDPLTVAHRQELQRLLDRCVQLGIVEHLPFGFLRVSRRFKENLRGAVSDLVATKGNIDPTESIMLAVLRCTPGLEEREWLELTRFMVSIMESFHRGNRR